MTRRQSKNIVLASNITGLGEVKKNNLEATENIFVYGCHGGRDQHTDYEWLNLNGDSNRVKLFVSNAVEEDDADIIQNDEKAKKFYHFTHLTLNRELALRLANNLRHWAINGTLDLGDKFDTPLMRKAPLEASRGQGLHVWKVSVETVVPARRRGKEKSLSYDMLIATERKTLETATRMAKNRVWYLKDRRAAVLETKYIGMLWM